MKLTEAKFQKQVVEYARLLGWRVAAVNRVCVRRPNGSAYYATPFGADGVGWPDLFLVRGKRAIAAELKVGKNTLSDEQVAWGLALFDAGIRCYVWRPDSWPEIEEVLT